MRRPVNNKSGEYYQVFVIIYTFMFRKENGHKNEWNGGKMLLIKTVPVVS